MWCPNDAASLFMHWTCHGVMCFECSGLQLLRLVEEEWEGAESRG